MSPSLGIKQNFPSELLSEGYLPLEKPSTQNIIFENGDIQAAKLRSKAWSQALPDTVLREYQFKLRDDTKFPLLFTKHDIAYRDSSNDRLVYLTPRYATGKVRVENGSAVVRGGLEVDNCDTDPVAWVTAQGANITLARNTTSPQDGTAFVRCDILAGAATGLVAYHDITSVNLSAYDSIGFWMRSNTTIASGVLKFLVDDTAACASPLETLTIPALTADTWTWVEIAFATPANLTAVVSIGLQMDTDTTMTVDIDQIVVGDWTDLLAANDMFTIGTTYSTADTWYTVSSVTDTTITLTASYAGSTASQQAYFVRLVYQGAATNYWRVITFNNTVIATNDGVDNLQTWNGSATTFSDLGGSPLKCRFITEYENYVITGYVYSGGSALPQQYEWCAIGDATNWSTGDSGAATIPGSAFITGFASGELEGFKLLTTEEAIYRLNLVSGDQVFDRQVVTKDIGVISNDSMVNKDRFVYAWTSDNKFRKISLSSWQSVSEPIDIITTDVHPDYEKNIQGVYDEQFGQILWLIPTSSSTGTLNQVLVYDIDNPSPAWGTLDVEGACFGTLLRETAYTWDTLPYATWEVWTWDQWDSRLGLANFPIT